MAWSSSPTAQSESAPSPKSLTSASCDVFVSWYSSISRWRTRRRSSASSGGVAREQPHRAGDQVVEVERARRGELLLVQHVDLADPLAGEVGLRGGEPLRGDQRVLRRRDPAPHRVGRQHLLGDRELRHRLLDQRRAGRRSRRSRSAAAGSPRARAGAAGAATRSGRSR